MIDAGLRGVEFISVNTDAQALLMNDAETKIHIGRELTRGLGAGSDPAIGQQAAEDHADEIAAALDGADMVFITVGEGGGTGTGAAPVIAELAKSRARSPSRVVTRPFGFEGRRRASQAEPGIPDSARRSTPRSSSPTIGCFPLPTRRPRWSTRSGWPMRSCSRVSGITDLITTPGLINTDFADVG